MSKIFGSIDYFTLRREDRSRVLVNYEFKEVGDGKNATWQEVTFYKKRNQNPSLSMVKNAIVSDINSQTDEKILGGFTWKPSEDAEEMKIWLSSENQFNYKAAYDLAIQTNGANLPITFKFGDDNNVVYHEFTTLEELSDFYMKSLTYINDCLAEGWSRKDSINWDDYKGIFDDAQTNENLSNVEGE